MDNIPKQSLSSSSLQMFNQHTHLMVNTVVEAKDTSFEYNSYIII